MSNHYQTLGVENTASQDDIKRAYRKLASQHHPDKGGDEEKFKKIKFAYEVLSDPIRRKQYDYDKTTYIKPGLQQEAVTQLSHIFYTFLFTLFLLYPYHLTLNNFENKYKNNNENINININCIGTFKNIF